MQGSDDYRAFVLSVSAWCSFITTTLQSNQLHRQALETTNQSIDTVNPYFFTALHSQLPSDWNKLVLTQNSFQQTQQHSFVCPLTLFFIVCCVFFPHPVSPPQCHHDRSVQQFLPDVRQGDRPRRDPGSMAGKQQAPSCAADTSGVYRRQAAARRRRSWQSGLHKKNPAHGVASVWEYYRHCSHQQPVHLPGSGQPGGPGTAMRMWTMTADVLLNWQKKTSTGIFDGLVKAW